MPHDRPFTTLLHPDQALTAEQAADWVRDLIDYYSRSVSALYHDTLPEEALPGYTETLRSLLECAGALEQHLCGMCFFLPDQLSRTVVAIIVAIYYQSALLDAFIEDPEADARVVVDEETLESMSLYLRRVAAHIEALCDWLASERYAMLQGVAKRAVTEMRNRIASATGSAGRRDILSCARNPRSTKAKCKTAEVPFARLDSFLHRLSPDHFLDEYSSSSTSSTVDLPFNPMVTLAGPSRVVGSYSPRAATPSPFHPSLPELGLNRAELEPERRPSLASSDTTCVEEPTLGSPFHLETKVHSSPDEIVEQTDFEPVPDAREPPPMRTSTKRRRRTTSTLAPSSSSSSNSDSLHPLKRRRQFKFSLRTFAPDGAEDVDKYIRAYVGRAVPVGCAPKGRASSPLPLPSRNLSTSPSASQTSASLRARSLSPLELGLGLRLEGMPPPSESANGVPAVWYGDGEHLAAPRRWGEVQGYGIDGTEADAGSEGGESDGESFTTAADGLYRDVEMEDESDASGASSRGEEEADAERDEEKHEGDDAPDVLARTSSPPPAPGLSSKAKGKRRCFADLFRTFRHIFNGR
ncbi:hypothetical protein LXA43DRAFT_584271 [Ganoderma leucocontextum]|nr:hypothetical protein LXA43DRAFT_584271 [Ganoderma leucocontextum]